MNSQSIRRKEVISLHSVTKTKNEAAVTVEELTLIGTYRANVTSRNVNIPDGAGNNILQRTVTFSIPLTSKTGAITYNDVLMFKDEQYVISSLDSLTDNKRKQLNIGVRF